MQAYKNTSNGSGQAELFKRPGLMAPPAPAVVGEKLERAAIRFYALRWRQFNDGHDLYMAKRSVERYNAERLAFAARHLEGVTV